jgi:SpoVK/Ycf46/Vps4 family AAA+-type ATPase
MAGPPLDWGSIAGYSTQLALLQETVLLPLLFPSFFSTHGIDPPKGILFYGPPGTGKTLAARVLAHVMASIAVPGEGVSSAQGTHSNEVVRPSFYMRKGADVLSKYVGESERALRLLFAEAERNSPSIIFFDEIDGLAPARSSRNDHVHASVVSTLLALMDGLESRGRVVVIGATNRVDALDPALRRPGRFDREVLFGLPDSSSRRSILDMYGKRMTHDVRGWLTQETGGFAGADLRALCAEASLSALRRIGLLDAIAGRSSSADTSSMVSRLRTSVGKLSSMDFTVEREDAAHALKRVVPASRRSQISLAQTLPPHLEQILAKPLQETIDTVSSVFLPPSLALSSLSASTNLMLAAHYRPWVLITSPGEYRGQHEILGAICHMYDSFSQVSLDLATLAADPNSRSLDEALVRAVSMARRSLPCLLIIPMLDLWYASASEQLRSLLVATLKQIPRTSPILVLATTDGPLGSLATEFSSVFADQVIQLKQFSSADKLQVFQHLAEQLGLSATEKSCLIEAVAKHVHNWSFDHVLKMFARMMRASLTAVGKITSHLLSEVLPQV